MIEKNQDICKILFISNSGGIGGAQQCLLDLILRLPKNIKPILIVSQEGIFSDILKCHNIEYYVVPFRGWWYSRFRIKLIERLINNLISIIRILFVIKNLNICLVYSNTLYSPIGAILSKILKVRHIWHVHEFPHLNKIQKFDFGLNLSMSIVNKNADIVICPSLALKNELAFFISEKKIHCIYNGIVFSEKLSSSIQKPSNGYLNKVYTILIIGSIIEFKGQFVAIQALNELLKRNLNVKLLILGDGDESYINELKLLIKRLGIQENITWLGFQKDVYQYILKADLVYVCSKFETFGMVVVEAMSVGCPVIATNTGGIPEIIKDGYNGFLYEFDDITILVEKTVALFKDKELYLKISKNSINTARLFFNVDAYSYSIIEKVILLIEK